MAFTIGQHVILKMNDVQVGNWEVILGTTNPSQVFVRALRVDFMVSTNLSSIIHMLIILLAIM